MYMFQCSSLSSSHRLLPCPVSTNLLSIVFVSKAALQIVHQYHLSRFHNGYIFSFVWLCDPLDYSLSGSSVHGIFQARILEWVTISFYRGSSWPRDWIHVFYVSCIAGGFFTCWAIPYIYMCVTFQYVSFWLTSLCIIGSTFIHLIRTDSNAFLFMAG